MLNLNTYPYFDDYDPSKGYHKILFHPAKPVQARELTQMQSILQEQIKRHGDHVFKNGTVVIPGHVFFDDKVKFLKLTEVYNQINVGSYLPDLIGKTITGDAEGITALVVHADGKTATDPDTLYIKYTSAAGTVNQFAAAETMTCAELPGLLFQVSPVTEYTGNASICTINDGVYYVNGYFVEVLKQSVTVSKYTTNASAVIGLDYIETVATENEDETLFDNAFGFTNYGAPGAHRLKISLTLNNKPYSYTSEDTSEVKFIDLLKIKNGNIEYMKNDTQYAEIEKWLARRTYEESGNYSVKPFTFAAYNYRNNNRGAWTTTTPYLLGDIVSNNGRFYIALSQGYSGGTAPVHTFGVASDGAIYWNEVPDKNLFINLGRKQITSTNINDHIDAEGKMVVTTSPGKAYVKGFEIEFNSSSDSLVSKARQTRQLNQSQLYAPAGSYSIVTNISGLPNVADNLTSVSIRDVGGNTIGSAWIRSLEYLTGTPGSTAEYRMFLFNIKMNKGKDYIRDAHSVYSVEFSANIKPTLIALSGSATPSGTTVTGVGTYFDFELSVGDRIKIGSSFTSVASITSPSTLTTSSTTTGTSETIYLIVSNIIRLGDYIRELPTPAINTLRNSLGEIDMEYVVMKSYAFSTVGTSYNITLTNGETFLPTEHIVSKVSDGSIVNAGFSLDTPATTLTITGLTTLTDYKVLVVVKRTGAFAKEKTKTLATKTLTLNNAGTQKFSSKNISLTEADCIRLIKVTESGSPTDKVNYVESGESNITRFYSFSSGQTSEFYDVGRIRTTRTATRPIRITFEYFIHSDGDYFSVDSYTSVPNALMVKTKVGDKTYYLPDCLDFRSRISDNGIDFNIANGASISDPLSSEQTMSTSYSYFLPRTDEVGISTNGEMSYAVGGKIGDGMVLATITVNPYTANPINDVLFVDDQVINYTMRAVKSLESRLSNVEYQVALSEIEKNTVNISIKDEFGLERDKNGFLIDEFDSFAISDIGNADLCSAIDPINKEVRAISVLEGVHLLEPAGTTNASRKAAKYQMTGALITLPYTEESMISQVFASDAELIQTYSTLDFTGQLILYPAADNYVDNQFAKINDPAQVLAPATISIDATSHVYGGRKYVNRYNWWNDEDYYNHYQWYHYDD